MTSTATRTPPPGTELLREEHQRLAAQVRDFADEVVAPASYTYDTERRLPMEIIAQMGEMGLFGLPIPREYDGQGRDYLSLCVAVEQLARVDQSIAVTLEAGLGLGAMPILTFGTEEQKRRHLPALARGEELAGFGLTEADAGSDAGGTRTTARLEDGQWVIDGTKQFITNSGTPITSLVTVTAVTGQKQRRDGSTTPELTSIIVPTDTPGFTALPGYDKVGWHTSDTHPLLLEDVRVPEENLLGERGTGFSNFLTILDQGRVAFAALGVGAAQGCLEQAVEYARTRVVFGRPLGENQHIAFTIARMEARVAAARALMHEAARRLDAGMDFSKEASLAKLVCSEAASANARDACQIWGGNGFLNENVVARHYRDSRVLEVGEGSTEVQLAIIAKHLGFPDALTR
ncbi:acyl-CoA dehydrogenase family protein [Brachybacterium saurashtrense]|uniref:Acyl-CoA dehydrogenase n=1 Tax=Brachybacterium saurashtrense TaxID=556288 RepID=A0A345YRX5_9MICO|nr:acyl-CoA dehydrogenase family protein [Brachybacterium saurashtrense]AXK46677.1 acyl-CoA dehydrogenase [Brachybacterium saurashtrense]RRR22391.1 acyl-CoA dehydrogenase [Brachybacterium saurashtrense]